MMQDKTLAIASRHLGLVPAGENVEAETLIARAAAQIAEIRHRPATRAGAACDAASRPPAHRACRRLGQRIAVARDDCLSLRLPSGAGGLAAAGRGNLVLLAAGQRDASAGSPMRSTCPAATPSCMPARLAAAPHFLGALREAAARGKTIYGECGGYMVMGETLTDARGETHRMAGLLPLHTSFAEPPPPSRLPGRDAAGADTCSGATRRAFAATNSTTRASSRKATPTRSSRFQTRAATISGMPGLRRGRVAGSFIHLIDEAD